jgi:hypothetical protein
LAFDLPGPNQDEYDLHLDNILNEIPITQKLEDPTNTTMNWQIMQAQVLKALCLTKNRTATGLDACPYELWKTLNTIHDDSTTHN